MRKLPEFRLYRNLHKKCFSIQKWDSVKKGYRLHSHQDELITFGSKFKVYESGRKKVIETKQKNVHAYVYFNDYSLIINHKDIMITDEITYDPYTMDSFTIKNSNIKVENSGKLLFMNNKCFKYVCKIG